MLKGELELFNLMIFDLSLNATRWFLPRLYLVVEINHDLVSHFEEGVSFTMLVYIWIA